MITGDCGVIRWTSCNRQYEGKARVTKMNNKTLRAELLNDVPSQSGGDPYKAGREIIVPIFGTPYNRFDSESA